MKKLLTVLLTAVVSVGLNAQEVKISGAKLWKTLTEVTYEISKDEYGDVYLPVFSKEIQAVEGQEVEVDGYIIPFEGMFKPTQLIISSLPISECFFCGSGGPETVMEVTMKEQIKYTTKRIRIRGKLALNKKDPDKLMYILTDGVFAGLAYDSY
ncbi:hypothetical protein [Roseivirga echinicomitans]|uniref:DUF3299 domain-containing protein n=1 Tax=Roseivirga echinicomitans TaxID=296218 RepID=A0A150XX59_9BACT|nr:hypothetical protein [Roseivirga echinicomitans]KYG83303.1 hypothetical protein AWN68_00365 [Roseivirga echinicomitans]